MSDAYTRMKLEWIDQVADDHELPALAFKLAHRITRYVNRQSGEAWPSQETLAEELRVEKRSIIRLLQLLAGRGHLTIAAGRGRGHSSRYRLALVPRQTTLIDVEVQPEKVTPESPITPEKVTQESPIAPEKVTLHAGKGDSRVTLLPLKNSLSKTPQPPEGGTCTLSDRDQWTGDPPTFGTFFASYRGSKAMNRRKAERAFGRLDAFDRAWANNAKPHYFAELDRQGDGKRARIGIDAHRFCDDRVFENFDEARPRATPAMPSPVAEDAPLWARARPLLRQALGAEMFDAWFTRVSFAAIEDGCARLFVPSKFLRSKLAEDQIYKPALAALRAVEPSVSRIEFVLGFANAPAAASPPAQLPLGPVVVHDAGARGIERRHEHCGDRPDVERQSPAAQAAEPHRRSVPGRLSRG